MKKILICGNGRLSKNLQKYFESLSVKFEVWSRADGAQSLRDKLGSASMVLFAVSDDAIEKLSCVVADIVQIPQVHFSGSYYNPKILGAHPLMTFTENLLKEEEYLTIPLVVDQSVENFKALFPFLENPVLVIKPEQKNLYHFYCVLSGNLSQMLWAESLRGFENELHLPREILLPYMKQSFLNLLKAYENPESILTGPIIRGDHGTRNRHLKAIQDEKLKNLYQEFWKWSEVTPL